MSPHFPSPLSRRVSGAFFVSLILLLVLALVPRGGVEAQQPVDVDSLRAQFLLDPVFLRTTPGSGMYIPGGVGASRGDVFAGFSYQDRTRFTRSNDGAVAFGFGLGNPVDRVGFEVAITSFSTQRSGFFNRTQASFKAHRLVGDGWSVALGWESAVVLAGDGGDGGDSQFAVVSRTLRLNEASRPLNSLTLTAGVGNGRFRTESAIFEDRSTLGVFGGGSLRVLPWASVIAEWTGQDVGAGVSLAPLARFPLIVNVGVTDIAGTAGDGARLTASGGIGSNLRFLF